MIVPVRNGASVRAANGSAVGGFIRGSQTTFRLRGHYPLFRGKKQAGVGATG
jgi:hypothetical protein